MNTEGHRFVNELTNRKVCADAIMFEQQQNKRCWAICNEPNRCALKHLRPGNFERMVNQKIVEKYDTLEALAKACGINEAELKKEIEGFNADIKAGKDL